MSATTHKPKVPDLTEAGGPAAGKIVPLEPLNGDGLPGRKRAERAARDEPPHLTDTGNAKRLAAQHGNELLYCAPWRTWMVWDGRRWAQDQLGQVVQRAKGTVRGIYAEVARIEDDKARGALRDHARRSEGQRATAGMIELAKDELAVTPNAFDGDDTRYLLNVLNGTLDLRTGKLREHRPEDRITKLAPVHFDPAARCPAWDAFLERVVPDAEVRAYLQRFAGYALTGDTGEQVFALLHGTGANGKSTFLETLMALAGDYAHKADFETFLEAAAARDRKGGARADLLALMGRRIVIAIEAGARRALDANTIKELTGGDTITTRGVYHAAETSFRPQGKIFLAANHRPEVRENTHAMWRRVHLVPFTVTIPKEERDPGLPERLREPGELAGILAWAVKGFMTVHHTATAPRLRPPAAVLAATEEYEAEQDKIGPFLKERCKRDPKASTSSAELYTAYQDWCGKAEEDVLSKTDFGAALKEKGYRPVRGGRDRKRGWGGIKLADDPTHEPAQTEAFASSVQAEPSNG